jgi:ribosomal protein S8
MLSILNDCLKSRRRFFKRVPYSKFNFMFLNNILKKGFIKQFNVVKVFSKKFKKDMLYIEGEIKFYRNKSLMKEIEIVSVTNYGTRYGRKALKYRSIKRNLTNQVCFFQTEKGLRTFDEMLKYKLGGFLLCRIIF